MYHVIYSNRAIYLYYINGTYTQNTQGYRTYRITILLFWEIHYFCKLFTRLRAVFDRLTLFEGVRKAYGGDMSGPCFLPHSLSKICYHFDVRRIFSSRGI